MTDLDPAAIMAIRERDAEAMTGPANDQLVYRERHALLAEVNRLAADLAAERVKVQRVEERISIWQGSPARITERLAADVFSAALAGEGAADPPQGWSPSTMPSSIDRPGAVQR